MIYNNMQYSDYYCHYLLKKFQFDRYTVNSLGYFLHWNLSQFNSNVHNSKKPYKYRYLIVTFILKMIHKLSVLAALFAITGYVTASIQLQDQTNILSEVEQDQNIEGTRGRMRLRAVCNFNGFSRLDLT